MLKFERIENTVFLRDYRTNVPLGYLVVDFRTKQILTTRQIVKNSERRARLLAKSLKEKSNYVKLVYEAKEKSYQNRNSISRLHEKSLDDVIRIPRELDLVCSLDHAIDIVMNGMGIANSTGRKLKAIRCEEKIRKVFTKLIDALSA